MTTNTSSSSSSVTVVVVALVVLTAIAAVPTTTAIPKGFARNVKHPNRPSTLAQQAGNYDVRDGPLSIAELRSAMFTDDNANLTQVTLWPQPVNMSAPSHEVYLLDPTAFTFTATGAGASSGILSRAFTRYHQLFFVWTQLPSQSQPRPSVVSGDVPMPLAGVTVNVTSDSEVLGLATDESYTILVSDDGRTASATITAPTVFGALRGLETFSQLIQYDLYLKQYSMQAVQISDAPRFPYRGILVDTARHYMSMSTLYAVCDAMSYNRMNVLHLHLIDDQSWPVVIEELPRLAGWAAFSNFTHIYTKDAIEGLVSYALDRGIRVIPEIDTPSHSDIIGKAYPDILTVCDCDGHDCPIGHTFRSMPDPTKQQTWTFLTTIFKEVGAMFPDEAFHIGGDEFWFAWQHAPTVQAFMKAHNYTSVYDMYHYYERNVIDIARAIGKKSIVAWEDIHGFQEPHEGDNTTYNAYPDVILDVWAGWIGNGGSWQDNFAKYTSKNASVILTGPWYVDVKSQHIYDTLWESMYGIDPRNFTGTDEQKAKVLGGHVSAWDDAINGDSSDLLQYIFPQSAAVAEMLWSSQEYTSKGPNRGRMHNHRCRLVQRGVPAGPVEIGFCPIEFNTPPVVPSPPDAPGAPVSAFSSPSVDMDAKVALLQAEIARLQAENTELRRAFASTTRVS